jgi:hypothetical protein
MSSVQTRVTAACGSKAIGPPIRCSPCVLSVSYPVNYYQDIMQIVRASEHLAFGKLVVGVLHEVIEPIESKSSRNLIHMSYLVGTHMP